MENGKNIDRDTEWLSAKLAEQGVFVTYSPLRTEVPFREYLSLPQGATVYEIAPRASLDPLKEALAAAGAAASSPTCVLMPGRSFDALGTRFGQGGGWYDRFLAAAPAGWLRIGFCFENQFSTEILVRKPWDQPMDIVCVASKEAHALRIIETNARKSDTLPS